MRRSAVVLVLAMGCGGAPSRPTAEPLSALHTPTRLFPLRAGTSWAFRNDPGGGLPAQTSVLRVVDSDGRVAHVESLATGDRRTYEVRPEGIFWADANTYLLRGPFELGASWPSSHGRTARITAVDVAVEVPTGSFAHCLTVEESGGESGMTVATTYCPDVGPTVVDAHQPLQLSAAGNRTHSELQAFDDGTTAD